MKQAVVKKNTQYNFMLKVYRQVMRDVSPAEQKKLDKKFRSAMRIFKKTGRWPKS
jgi:hypothetical protein